MESGTAESPQVQQVTTYFVVKCAAIENLHRCIETGIWACRDRQYPPHPKDLLSSAHEKGRVILVFSVNNQHGWHGYCESNFNCRDLKNVSENATKKEIDTVYVDCDCDNLGDTSGPSNNGNEDDASPWHRFPVTWKVHLQDMSKLACLSSEKTKHLQLPDGSPVNKARNWQQISEDTGGQLCSLINEYREGLLQKKREMDLAKEMQCEVSFFKDEEHAVDSKSQSSSEFGGWDVVIEKVQRELGKVHLACPFGSQRYNCNLPGSDNDIFLVYQAKTTDILGLDPPKQTIKNSDRAVVDYTILEIQRYCELLVAGDPRCIETLFLSKDEGLALASEQWEQLQAIRNTLLTQKCLEKYMKEAQGTTGVKQLQKWRSNNGLTEQLPHKLSKLGYIVLRLLQNARDMCVSGSLQVYRKTDSTERQELLAARNGEFSYTELMDVCRRYQEEIEPLKPSLPASLKEARADVQKWLLDCRLEDLQLKSS
ncbi:uncharacterized protein LOC101860115 [Aplysia californica]|uniref:Uncharacterized protein LOC101860115 n=1 Tax=Aplysia californica TaxID=6500 RepID=A0ABM0JZL4_APLCA|nr:uncharacterized protein LOC101860115 [Aplysia californica]